MILLAIFLASTDPLPDQYTETVKPTGMLDRAELKGPPPWCKGAFEGETGWDIHRLGRTVTSDNNRVEAAIQLCEAPNQPTWQKAAQNLIQSFMNTYNLSQADAEKRIEAAIAKRKKDKANEGKEPSDEERFAFTENAYNVTKPAPGIAEAKLTKMSWCDGIQLTERWDMRAISRTVGARWGIEGVVSGAKQLCFRQNDPTWITEANYVVQKWMNWTGLSQADAEKALRIRVRDEKFKAERDALCKALEPNSELMGSEKAFAEAQQHFFACKNDFQTMWQKKGSLPELTFWVDPMTNPPNEVVRLVMLYDMMSDPDDKEFPSKDASNNLPLLRYAVVQQDVAAIDTAALDKMLAAAPYNDYARVIAMETLGVLRHWAKVYEMAVDKMTKNDADYADVLRNAPKKGWQQWATVTAQWKPEIARSNAFEAKLSSPSRKALKGCTAELLPDAQKLVKSYKLSEYNDLKTKLAGDPIASLLFSRLAVCSAYEKIDGMPGVFRDLVQGGRNLRGPRTMAYYAVVDALAEAIKDRPKMALSMSNFYGTSGNLMTMYSREFTFSGGAGRGPDSDEPKGIVASVSKAGNEVEIKFKHTKYTYPEAYCSDDKSHPLKIESDGTIRYYQNCTYTGKMLSFDTTPQPIKIAPHMATGVKPGVYVAGNTSTVHFVKANPKDKKIQTFYGFDL